MTKLKLKKQTVKAVVIHAVFLIVVYILQAEVFFLRYYKVNPFELMKDMSLYDLQVYVKQIEKEEKKERDSFKKKDIMTALRQICEILNWIFYKK